MSEKRKPAMRFETVAIHAGQRPDPTYGAMSPPVYQTSNFAFEDVGKTRGYDYSRTANPTRKILEDTVARLEGGKAGFAFATGIPAETRVMYLLRAGDHVISGDDVCGRTLGIGACHHGHPEKGRPYKIPETAADGLMGPVGG